MSPALSPGPPNPRAPAMSKFTTTTTVVHADGTSVQTVTTSGGGDAAGLTLASLQDGGMETDGGIGEKAAP